MPSFTPVNVESIYAALFAFLKAGLVTNADPALFVTVGRRHIQGQSLTPAQQPALFSIAYEDDQVPRPQSTPGKKTLEARLFVYAFVSALNQPPGQETLVAETLVSNLLFAVESVLVSNLSSNYKQTLGDIVQHCWIEGKVLRFYGEKSQQAGAIVSVKILCP
jgi:hypothetical protein